MKPQEAEQKRRLIGWLNLCSERGKATGVAVRATARANIAREVKKGESMKPAQRNKNDEKRPWATARANIVREVEKGESMKPAQRNKNDEKHPWATARANISTHL